MNYGDNKIVTSSDHIHASSRNDQSYTTLINAIEQGFPSKRYLTEPEFHASSGVHHRHSNDKGFSILMYQ